jgi:4-nitrophenyl phosphatase
MRCFLLDMDGTFYLENHLLPGALEFFLFCHKNNILIYFITNNSSRNARNYQHKLSALGVPPDAINIITSGMATCRYLNSHYHGKKVYLAGTQALEEEFILNNISLVSEEPDLLVLGFDTTITYDKLRKICDLIRTGIPYFATHPDINCPVQGGAMPDIGSMIAFIEASTGRNPDIIVGKPHQPMMDAILEKVNLTTDKICMVGDRLYTDIAMGRNGIHTILVLSGETSLEMSQKSKYKADLVLENLGTALKLLLQ